ncbi:MAG: type IIA DNA topoisomerase subunit B [Oligoflexales bacterium]|nr:type IIA DNA topoisomerase subunit B [Oligoflexales bacterium]
MVSAYTEENIRSLDWREHIRKRPGMYIGKLGDGSSPDDGIYVLVKEVIDNSVDEYVMGAGKTIEVSIEDGCVSIRDYGRGIPLGKVVDCVSQINTGGKYDSGAFKKSVGLNGVGTKAVNALSEHFLVQSFRDGKTKSATFSRGELIKEKRTSKTDEKNGTLIKFRPDNEIFTGFRFIHDVLSEMFWNYAYLNTGLKISFNKQVFTSKQGLLDLLSKKVKDDDIRYPIIHLKGEDIEVALSHGSSYGENHYSFVNGQYTTMGGTHQSAMREGFVKTVREFFKKDFDANDIRAGMIGAISIRVEEPVFESQTKTKLGSQAISPGGPTVRSWVVDFLRKALDDFLHKNDTVSKELLKKIQQSEKERKEIAGIRKLAQERSKKANIYNKKLRDCQVHFNSKNPQHRQSTIFITEGDSASGSITKSRNVKYQAVFSLRGKPLNCYGLSKKVVYENEEFNLLQHALDIETSIDNLRFNKVIIATDADVDGMHIRLLLMTFFLQFFPELVRRGHIFILKTPLFRVRNKKKTIYCYDEQEKAAALSLLGKNPEITRFKGLGEISPDEFGQFIGKDIRLEPVSFDQSTSLTGLLKYYMGKNTGERQNFIIDNLRIEENVNEQRMDA